MFARGLVKSMIIIGSASFLNIVIGIIRVKVLAVLLGPTGVGVLGIFNNIQTTGTHLAGMGLGTSGVRELAASVEDSAVLARVRKALLAANLTFGVIGMGVVWLLRERLSLWVFDDPSRSGEIGLLGIGVFLSLVAGSQTALLQGLRRIKDLASVNVLGAVIATVVGIAVVWALGFDGIVWFVLIAPAANVLVATWFTARLPRQPVRMSLLDLVAHCRAMVSLGVVFMMGSLLAALSVLVVRALIVRGLGIEAAGHFQASWAISTQYVGFILTAMLADYLPRLSGVIGDEEGSNDLVNTQAQITLLLGGPVLLAALALAPWAIALLYSAAFHPAAELLRWQALGNVLKVLASPVGLINVARARGGLFILTEASWNLVFVLTTWATMPGLGLVGTGVAFVVSYALQLALLTLIVRRVHGFRWHRETVLLGVVLFGAGTLVLVLSYASSLAAALVGVAAAAGMAVFNLRAIVRKIGTQGRFGSRIARLYQWFGWPVEP